MKGDADVVHSGVTALSYARSMAHDIAGILKQAVSDASRNNSNGKFRRCSARINEAAQKINESAQELGRIGQTLQSLEYLLRELDS